MNKKKQVKKQSESSLEKILNDGDKAEIRALFSFDNTDTEQEVLFKFNLWGRYFFPKFYKFKDADFHKDIDSNNYRVYKGDIKFFINIVFRGGSKTTRTKLFIAYCIANDTDKTRKFFKVLTKDIANAKQIVTDIFNLLITIQGYYPEIFQKTDFKKEERMDSFTTHTGVKMRAGTVGTDQRGQIQEDARPDFIFYDDFETRKTLRSAVETKAIWDNMEEAKNGLSKNGGSVYACNYLSERGNVHKLVEKKDNENTEVLVVPIKFNGKSMWDYFTMNDIDALEKDADDFAGEYMCEPSAGHDIFFDRHSLERQITKEPLRVVADFKIFYEYNPSHRYGMGADIGGGVGLDHSTTCIWDFSTIPNRVVATFKSNTIKPDIFGDEIKREAEIFGEPIVAPENNKFDMTIGRLKQIYKNIYFTEDKVVRAGMPPRTKTFGWNTNRMTKPKMLFELKKAIEDGQAELTDSSLIAELKSYTRDDLMDNDEDPRLTTRHFDLLIACAIGYQMRNWAESVKLEKAYQQPAYENPLLDN